MQQKIAIRAYSVYEINYLIWVLFSIGNQPTICMYFGGLTFAERSML